MYKNWRPLVEFLDAQSCELLIKGLFAFACDGEVRSFDNPALSAIYHTMIDAIAADDEKYMERCEQNKRNRSGGIKDTKSDNCEQAMTVVNERERPITDVLHSSPIGNDEDMDMTGHDIGEDKRRQDNEKVEEVQAALHARLLEARERIEQNARRA
ncbi:DUF6291 domain-containing protein [Ruminococcus albus]|nr:DUF6291 domain-containing protein [Ruminococcus albus]